MTEGLFVGTEGALSIVPSTTSKVSAGTSDVKWLIDELCDYATLVFDPSAAYGIFPQPFPYDPFRANRFNAFISTAGTTITSDPTFVQTHIGQNVSVASYGIVDPLAALRERLLERISELNAADESPVYESDPQPVNWNRLGRLRGIGARESDDLYQWYAQKEE
jgi:hypothetical protein